MLDVKYSGGAASAPSKPKDTAGADGIKTGTGTATGTGTGSGQPITIAEEQVLMKRFAKPTGQIKGLVNMINATADELDL